MAGPYVGIASPRLNYDKGYADIDVDDNGDLEMVEGPAEVMQSDELAIRMARGGYMFDLNEGFPWHKYEKAYFYNFVFSMLRSDMYEMLSADKRNKAIEVEVGPRSRENRQVDVGIRGVTHTNEVLKGSFSLGL